MRTANKYLTEGVNVTPKFIKDGIEFVKLLEKKNIKLTDWDKKGNIEIAIKNNRRWYDIKEAISFLLMEL